LIEQKKNGRQPTAWTRPTLREICIGMGIIDHVIARI
jgi:hypothetical protein